MCQFTKKTKETILFKTEYKNYRKQQKILENGSNIFFLTSQVVSKKYLIEQDRVITKRALRLVQSDFSATFSEILLKDKSVTIHQRNLNTRI